MNRNKTNLVMFIFIISIIVLSISFYPLLFPLGVMTPNKTDYGLYGGLSDSYFFEPIGYDNPFVFWFPQCADPPGPNDALWDFRDRVTPLVAATGREIIPITPGRINYWVQPLSEWKKDLIFLIEDCINFDYVDKMVIGEEHVGGNPPDGWLDAIYHHIKAHYPNLQVYQWFQDTHDFDRGCGADGYVYDRYWDPVGFERDIRKLKASGKPVYACLNFAYEGSWTDMYSNALQELAVCQELGVDVFFYTAEWLNGYGTWGWRDQTHPKAIERWNHALEVAREAIGATEPSVTGADGYFKINGQTVTESSLIYVNSPELTFTFIPTENASLITKVEVVVNGTIITLVKTGEEWVGTYTLPEEGKYEIKGFFYVDSSKTLRMSVLAGFGEDYRPTTGDVFSFYMQQYFGLILAIVMVVVIIAVAFVSVGQSRRGVL